MGRNWAVITDYTTTPRPQTDMDRNLIKQKTKEIVDNRNEIIDMIAKLSA